jgi:hypothetical protein
MSKAAPINPAKRPTRNQRGAVAYCLSRYHPAKAGTAIIQGKAKANPAIVTACRQFTPPAWFSSSEGILQRGVGVPPPLRGVAAGGGASVGFFSIIIP